MLPLASTHRYPAGIGAGTWVPFWLGMAGAEEAPSRVCGTKAR